MQLKFKKIIAREFMVTLGCLLIGCLFIFAIQIYNYRLDSQQGDIFSEKYVKIHLVDSLTKPYKPKLDNQEWFFEKAKFYYAQGDYENSDQLWTRLAYLFQTDSVINKWENVWDNSLKEVLQEIGFENGKAFNSFIEINSLSDEESKSFEEVRTINEEIYQLNEKSKYIGFRKFDYDDQVESTSILLLIIGTICFPIRYLIYAIRWSYQVLKQKE